MIFDSVYDSYRGVVTYVRMIDGTLSPRERIQMMSTRAIHELLEIGVSSPEPTPTKGLGVGEVGYLITGVKDVRQSKVGDTVTNAAKPSKQALPGYTDPKPMVFSGLYPIDGSDYPRAARGARQAQALGCLAQLRARDLGRARLRLPLRVPRPAAPRDHHRAPGARVRPRPHLDGAVGHLRGHDRRQQDRTRSPTRASSRRGRRSPASPSRW